MTPEKKRESDRRGADKRANVVPIAFGDRRKGSSSIRHRSAALRVKP